MRIGPSGKSCAGSCAAFEKTDIVEMQVLLPECGLQAGDFRRQKGPQVASLAPHSEADQAVTHHGVYFDVAKSLGLNP